MSVYSIFHQSFFPNGFILLLAAEFKNTFQASIFRKIPIQNMFNFVHVYKEKPFPNSR